MDTDKKDTLSDSANSDSSASEQCEFAPGEPLDGEVVLAELRKLRT